MCHVCYEFELSEEKCQVLQRFNVVEHTTNFLSDITRNTQQNPFVFNLP